MAAVVAQQPTGAIEQGDPETHRPVGIFPNRAVTRRLTGATLIERPGERAESRRYLTFASAIDDHNLPVSDALEVAASTT